MPVTLGAKPTEVNFDPSALTPPAGRVFATWQGSDAYPDPNDPQKLVRDLGAHVANLGGVNSQSGSTYSLQASDQGKLVVMSNASDPVLTLDSTLANGFLCGVLFTGAGGGEGTPSSGTLNGASSKHFIQGAGGLLFFNGTNWWLVPDAAVAAFYQTMQQAGTSRTQRAKLNFLAPMTATDNSGNDSTDVAVSNFVGDSGSGGVKGLVPAPGAGDAAAGKFLKADGSFAVPSGGAVSSVFGRTGAVVATSGDYTAAQVTGAASQTGVQNESYNYGADTGAANAYVVALSPAVGSYTAGQRIATTIAHTNTGSSTLDWGAGTKTIKKLDGSTNLAAGDLVAGQLAIFQYDGTNVQLISPVGTGGSGFTAGGDLSGSSSSQTVIGWQGKALDSTIGSPSDGQIATYSAAAGKWIAGAGGAISSLSPFNNMLAPSPVLAPNLAALTWQNPGSATAVSNGGGALVVSDNVAFHNLRLLYKASVPASADWSLVIGCLMQSTLGGFEMGIGMRESSSSKIILQIIQATSNSTVYGVFKFSNSTTFAGNYVSLGASVSASTITWFKVTYTQSTGKYQWYLSPDGQTWISMFGPTLANDFFSSKADQVGLIFSTGSVSLAQAGIFVHAAFSW